MSDRWIQFEENLSFIICDGIYEVVSKEYWTKLEAIVKERAKENTNFLTGLNKIHDKKSK